MKQLASASCFSDLNFFLTRPGGIWGNPYVTTSVYGGKSYRERKWGRRGGTGNRTPCETSAHTQGFRPGAGPPGAAQYTRQLRFSFQQQPHKATYPARAFARGTGPPGSQPDDWWLGEFSHENNHLPWRGRSTLRLPPVLAHPGVQYARC